MGISCKTAVDYISKREEGKLNFNQKIQLVYHLTICYVCKRFEKHNEIIKSVFRSNINSKIDVLQNADKEEMINALEEIS